MSIGTHKTTIVHCDNGWTEVTYHETKIVRFNDKNIILDTGGWKTVTTKRRMNQVSEHYNLEFNVYQKNFNWFVVSHINGLVNFNNNQLSLDR